MVICDLNDLSPHPIDDEAFQLVNDSANSQLHADVIAEQLCLEESPETRSSPWETRSSTRWASARGRSVRSTCPGRPSRHDSYRGPAGLSDSANEEISILSELLAEQID